MFTVSELTELLSTDRVAAAAAAVAAVGLTFVVARSLISDDKSKPNPLPTPASTLPVLANTLDVMSKHRHHLHDWIAEQSNLVNAGPWVLKVIGRSPTVVLTSPDDFEDVVNNHRESLDQRGPHSIDSASDFLGRGIIIADGQDWYFQRKVSSHLFSMKMMQEVMHDVVREKAALLCKVLDIYVERGQPVSLARQLMFFTSDVFSKIGFGVELHCLENGLEGKTHEFIEAYMASSTCTTRRFQQPVWLWKLKRWLSIGEEGELKKHLKIVNSFAYEMISASIAAKNERSGDAQPPKDLVSLFLNTAMEGREEISGGDEKAEMAFIRDMAINFIFAGKDTTSVAISWFIVMMNRYPAVLAKVRAEIAAEVPGLVDGSIDIPKIDDLKSLVYLEAAIRENLRLNSPAPTISRTAVSGAMLRSGAYIPKGWRMIFSVYGSGRQTAVWGADAAEFKPERWIDTETNTIIPLPAYKAFVFAAGEHMCPGRKMAMMEMKVALAVLLTRFDFKTVEDPFEITYTTGITHAVKGLLMTSVSKRHPSTAV